MSNQTHRRSRADQDNEDRGSRRPPRKNNNTALVAGGIFVFALVAIGAAGWLNRGKTAKASDEPAKTIDDVMQAKSPFDGIEAEDGPTPMSPGGRRGEATNLAPKEILDTPLWIAAVAKAQTGFAVVQEAEAAKKAGKNDTYIDKAVEARGIFDEAIIATADWETGLQDTYGDNDVLVKKIVRERTRWFDVLDKYHGLRRD